MSKTANRYRDILDPSDPYWPRVRRLHTHFWANGVLSQKPVSIVFDLFLWLCCSLFGTLFSLVWRGGLLIGILFFVDRLVPGVVSCIFLQSLGYEVSLLVLSHCTVIEAPYWPVISIVLLILVGLFLIYPVKRSLEKALEITFMSLTIITLGYPLKVV